MSLSAISKVSGVSHITEQSGKAPWLSVPSVHTDMLTDQFSWSLNGGESSVSGQVWGKGLWAPWNPHPQALPLLEPHREAWTCSNLGTAPPIHPCSPVFLQTSLHCLLLQEQSSIIPSVSLECYKTKARKGWRWSSRGLTTDAFGPPPPPNMINDHTEQ